MIESGKSNCKVGVREQIADFHLYFSLLFPTLLSFSSYINAYLFSSSLYSSLLLERTYADFFH